MKNQAAYLHGTNHMFIKEIPMPIPKENEALVKVKVVGICGSDVHYYQHGRIGDFVVTGDLVLGHECAGEVVAVGSAVKTLSVGDRVAPEPGKTCGKCKYCKTGKYNLCPEVEFFATPPYHGVFANYVTHPEDMCFKLPDHVSYLEGALVEPLSVGLHASGIGEVKLGDTVVIFGAGCIGLVTLLSCKARGASKVHVVDVLENRLETARRLGATETIHAQECNVADRIAALTAGQGADVVIETAGSEVTVRQTADVVSRGGTIVLVGMTAKDESSFNFMKLMGKEGQIKTIFRYRNLYPVAISAIASGAIDVKSIVSHEFDFDHVKEAFDFVVSNARDVVKAVIRID